jgi:hypothetical protein
VHGLRQAIEQRGRELFVPPNTVRPYAEAMFRRCGPTLAGRGKGIVETDPGVVGRTAGQFLQKPFINNATVSG